MKISHGICLAAIGTALAIPAESTAQDKAALPIDGAMLYGTYCVDCHGKDAEGQGPMAATLGAKVPDLTRLAARNGGVFPLARVEHLLTVKMPPPITHGGIVMPTWGVVFSSGDAGARNAKLRARNIARYLETIQK